MRQTARPVYYEPIKHAASIHSNFPPPPCLGRKGTKHHAMQLHGIPPTRHPVPPACSRANVIPAASSDSIGGGNALPDLPVITCLPFQGARVSAGSGGHPPNRYPAALELRLAATAHLQGGKLHLFLQGFGRFLSRCHHRTAVRQAGQQLSHIDRADNFQKSIRSIAFQADNRFGRIMHSDPLFPAKRFDLFPIELLLPGASKIILVSPVQKPPDPPHVVVPIRVKEIHRPPGRPRRETPQQQKPGSFRQERLPRVAFHLTGNNRNARIFRASRTLSFLARRTPGALLARPARLAMTAPAGKLGPARPPVFPCTNHLAKVFARCKARAYASKPASKPAKVRKTARNSKQEAGRWQKKTMAKKQPAGHGRLTKKPSKKLFPLTKEQAVPHAMPKNFLI